MKPSEDPMGEMAVKEETSFWRVPATRTTSPVIVFSRIGMAVVANMVGVQIRAVPKEKVVC
jgi:hypothetical protein